MIDAVADLAGRGKDVTLTIIGDGEARAQLQAQVQSLGMEKHVLFAGRVSPEEARALQAKAALVCIPRRPFEVCRIVPPIKLVEAMAMGKPVLVPDLPVFQDEVGPCRSVRFFKAGDVQDLARVLDETFQAGPEVLAQDGAWHVKRPRSVAVGLTLWCMLCRPGLIHDRSRNPGFGGAHLYAPNRQRRRQARGAVWAIESSLGVGLFHGRLPVSRMLYPYSEPAQLRGGHLLLEA
nr:glycosyltransferase [Alcaligenes sp. HPC1271]